MQLVEKEVNETMADKRRHCIQHINKKEHKVWDLADITYIVVDTRINNNADSSDDTDYDTRYSLEGIELLCDSNL